MNFYPIITTIVPMECRDFYVKAFDAQVLFQTDWYVHLKLGGGEIHVVGWFEKPHYDAESHNLVWAIEAKGEVDTDRSVNYDVRLLGRKGYISATLVTDPGPLHADLPHVQTLLSGFSFQEGKRYADFVSGDKVAEYGLTALIAGGAGAAAMKLGLFAYLGKLFAKGGKLIVAGLVALGAGIKKMLGMRKKEEAGAPPLAP